MLSPTRHLTQEMASIRPLYRAAPTASWGPKSASDLLQGVKLRNATWNSSLSITATGSYSFESFSMARRYSSSTVSR